MSDQKVLTVPLMFSRFILCDSDEIYMSLDGSSDDSEAIEELHQKKKRLLDEIDFSK